MIQILVYRFNYQIQMPFLITIYNNTWIYMIKEKSYIMIEE